MAATKPDNKKGLRRVTASRPDSPLYCIYFYYIKVNPPNPPETRVYYHFDRRTPVTNIENEITKLTINAYDDENNPPCVGSKFSDLDWRRKSYLVVMVEGYPLKRPPFSMKEVDNPNRNTFGPVTPYNVPVKNSDGNSITIMGGYLKNIMKRWDKFEDIEPEKYEKFKVVLNPPIRPFYPDSGGTNMGPPIGPP